MFSCCWLVLLAVACLIHAADNSATQAAVRRRPSKHSSTSTSSSSGTGSVISLSLSSSESEGRDHYSGTLSEEDDEVGSDEEKSRCLGPAGGCGRALNLRHSPGKTGLLVVADVALMVAFTVPLMVITSRFGRYCRNQINDFTTVQQCYPDAYSSLVASIAAVEPLHILVDIGLFTFGIVYAMFGSKRASTDHWDGLLAILALLTLFGRIVGTIGTVFMLPWEAASNTTSTAMFQAALGTASGTFIGLESFFLLLMLLSFSRDLYRRHENLSSV